MFPVPLGSIPECPAESCAEIKASEGNNAVSGNYWFDSIKPGEVVQAPCNVLVEGMKNLSERSILLNISEFRLFAPKNLSVAKNCITVDQTTRLDSSIPQSYKDEFLLIVP